VLRFGDTRRNTCLTFLAVAAAAAAVVTAAAAGRTTRASTKQLSWYSRWLLH
jgi:hypothetical protein